MRLFSLIKMDVTFQIRHGFYYAYALVSLFYIGILMYVPKSIIHDTSIFIIFTDPSVLGFFFVGGLILLERSQSIFPSLFISSISIHEYVWSKVLSLTCLAIISSLVIFSVIHLNSFDFFPFILAVVFCSVFFTLIGIVLSVRVESINAFLYMSPIFVVLFYLPLVSFFNVYDSILFYLLPTQAVLVLLEGSLTELSLGMYIYAIITSCIWIALAYGWAYYSMNRFIKYKYFH
ncbi:hypothetical protein GMD78_18340 [Ornithinibacillus sp. L9]|uniref:Fluoroquinolone transport system permease protein n=1 Tax=Ornithinibacillus caprae TaxID=2678566 RepID=A0A6N8FNF1_9BACI|nr:hypothetical protein [Ornithinibacillus caprae]MUK90336.1 hypothetical protein [Ornithinibacillus caprae]